MNRNFLRALIRVCRGIADRPALVLVCGGVITVLCAAMVASAVMERSGADALAWGLLTTTCLTVSMFGWIAAHIRKARPTPEQLLIQEVMDDLAMEEAAARAAEREKGTFGQPQSPPSAPWEKQPDWWKGE